MKEELTKEEQAVIDSLQNKITEEQLLLILLEPVYESLHKKGILRFN